MYQIDWSKYLIPNRIRPSVFQEKHSSDTPVDYRNPYESDLGRVVFTSAIRRMHDKTQVIPLTSGDSVHTRLTHSIEVMNIAMSLGNDLCRKPEFQKLYGDASFELERSIPKILATAGFFHDVGNPPFGHFGETIIKNYFKKYFNGDYKKHLKNLELTDEQKLDFTQFDGNAQGFRVITKLQYIGDLAGLNLTYATLGAYLKYPNKGPKEGPEAYIGSHKHGIYSSEYDIFDKIVQNCNMKGSNCKVKRHPLAYLVEAADSICYLTMDIEDGYTMGWYTFRQVVDFINKKMNGSSDILNLINFNEKVEKKENNGGVINSYKKNDKRCMVDFRVNLIQYLVQTALRNFISHLKEIDKGTYNKELLFDDSNCVANALQEFARKNIFNQKEIVQSELTGNSVVNGLLDILLGYVFSEEDQYYNRIKAIISKTSLKVAYHEEYYQDDYYHSYIDNNQYTTDRPESHESFYNELDISKMSQYSKLRMVVDFVSGMTDKYAVKLFQQLSGQRL